MIKPVPIDDFERVFGSLIELSSVALGSTIESVSDEFFADASCLLSVPPSQSLKGQFGPKGALFDGWESRRHNPTYDWTIVKLGALGKIAGVDIDTRHFNGNESPASDVWGAFAPDGQAVPHDSPLWVRLMPLSPLGPASQHLFLFDQVSEPVTHLKLTMHPDGGIGRFRAYGSVIPSASASDEAVDLASVLSGATCTGESDQHFGRGGNIILPGRGKDMGDGWETKRSRGRLGSGGGDWVVIKLGEPGHLEWADIDTLHFVGNFPESAQLFGIVSDQDLPSQDGDWKPLMERTKMGPHRHHYFQLSQPETAFTHVRISIFPDGGVKRVRIFGRSAVKFPSYSSLVPLPSPEPSVIAKGASVIAQATGLGSSTPSSAASVPKLPAVPLTPSAFSNYGSVIQSYPDHRSAPKGIVIKPVNFGTAFKFNHLSPVTFVQPPQAPGAKGEVNFCTFRCDQQNGVKTSSGKEQWEVKVLERHEFSSQAFVPMGGGGDRYLVLVALPGSDGKPDLATLRAFMATSSQGISYHPNIWHHPLIALDNVTDFGCMVYETGIAAIDCEIHEFGHTVAVVEEV